MPVRTHVGNGALFITAHPSKTDVILEEVVDDVWLVLGSYSVCERSLEMFLDDLVHSQLSWEEEELH